MKIKRNIKLKSFKLNKIIYNSIEAKSKKSNFWLNNLTTNIFNSQNEKIFKNNYDINSTENTYNSKNKIKLNNISNNNIKNFLSLNKEMKINFPLDNNIGNKCFSVPQTLNYYGRNNIKINAANAVKKMNKLLLKKNINYLSLPKNPFINITVKQNKNIFNSFNKSDKKIINMKKNNFLLNDKKNKYIDYYLNDLDEIKIKRKKISLYEKEKKREKDKYNKMLKEKFKELEACEKKFDIVIDNTLLKLNNEEKNLYK